MSSFKECAVKAQQAADLLRNDLLQANSAADPVQQVIVLRLIHQAATLHSELLQLVGALQ